MLEVFRYQYTPRGGSSKLCTWSRGESNSRPNKCQIRFLQVYSRHLISETRRSRTNLRVSQSLFLSFTTRRSQSRCFVGVMGGGCVQSKNACGGPMAYASSLGIRQPWHTEYCHLGFEFWDLRANDPTHDLLTYPAPCCQNRSAPVIVESLK